MRAESAVAAVDSCVGLRGIASTRSLDYLARMLNYLAQLPQCRAPWLLLALSAFTLELAALYFQYAMKLDPCVLCVYERTAVAGVLFAGIIAASAPRLAIVRWLGLTLWGGSAAGGLYFAMRHVGVQFGEGIDLSCSYFAEFPTWAPLDQWWPAVFQPSGFCSDINWVFLSLSMPQWMLVIFAAQLAILCLVVVAGLSARLRA